MNFVCKYSTVLFDLDGTISNSAQGVRDGITYALTQMEKPVPDLSDASLYVGPPLLSTFIKVCCLTPKEAERALEIYREYYAATGKQKNYLYDGIDKLAADVHKSGAITAVATSKYEPFAREVLEMLGIDDKFDYVFGATLDYSRKEKADVIRYAKEQIGLNKFGKAVLIGDTVFDMMGAKETGIDFIGVLYGFGKKDQMQAAGATNFANTAAEVYGFLV
ncbi:phosphoglycolate phosphatase [Clostridia bacterium]|nr:phosphoglycolate phosphatase [Clostridia bacterium]